MKYIKTDIEDCYLIVYDTIHDNRGYFAVPFVETEFAQNIPQYRPFVQDNNSYSSKNVIRGLHFQTGEHEQAKLVTCTHGLVLDVIVDYRKNSSSYGKVVKIELGFGLNRQIFIPRGCAHGFSVLSEHALFQYKVDNFYNKQSERGIIYNDPTLSIDWQIPKGAEIISDKDKELPNFLSLDDI